MRLLKIEREEKFVRYTIEQTGHMAEKETTETCHEAPLQSFDDALQALGNVAAKIIELRNDSGVTVKWLSIRRTKHGTRSAVIKIVKHLNCTDQGHPLKTPTFQFDEPAQDEAVARECTKEQAELINTVIAEAEKYASGDRQQMLLGMEPVEPEGGSAESDSDLLSQGVGAGPN